MSTYQEEETILREAIESIRLQTCRDWELVIIQDDPQNERHRQILQEYVEKDSRIRYFRNETNQGLARSMNRAIKEAKGEYIARMDADDIAYPRRLEKELQYLQEHRCDLIGGLLHVISAEKKEVYAVGIVPERNETIRRCLRYGDCVAHPSWFTTKQFYLDMGGYRPVAACEDYDLLLRAALAGKRFGNLNEEVMHYRMSASSISRENLYKQYLTMRYLSKQYRKKKIPERSEIEGYLKQNFSAEKAENYLRAEEVFYHALNKLQQKQPFSAVITAARIPFLSLAYTDKICRFLRLHLAARGERR
ncbi:MAG: glycosyltransferase [Erysipelotrichaceae bacterium]|nr:glycosyltransferase [Erysipelotrichaceae bacterium]